VALSLEIGEEARADLGGVHVREYRERGASHSSGFLDDPMGRWRSRYNAIDQWRLAARCLLRWSPLDLIEFLSQASLLPSNPHFVFLSMKSKLLITGGTGFLGRRLALALRDEYDVVLTGRNNKQNMLAQSFTGCDVLPMDVANIEAVRDIFTETRPHTVIHAAATKFVDLAERMPMECVDVNVTGSQNVARVAVEKGVDTVVGISTDKAAPPVRNTYGLSKALMERMFCSMNGKTKTKFACARYGNVAWSTGSVLPLWKRMHEDGGVIGTTGPDMTRFFFTVDEAVKLILTAIEHIDELQGKVISREMKSALIRELLDVWIANKGGTWKQIDGRPGERNLEYLIGDLELEYTEEKTFDGIKHFIISFNEKTRRPISVGLNSDNAQRLSRDEMYDIISRVPMEEQ
jgi:FlaA1/EpsC-like NDP-sugar epimerase